MEEWKQRAQLGSCYWKSWCKLMVARPSVVGYILEVYPKELSDGLDEGCEKEMLRMTPNVL